MPIQQSRLLRGGAVSEAAKGAGGIFAFLLSATAVVIVIAAWLSGYDPAVIDEMAQMPPLRVLSAVRLTDAPTAVSRLMYMLTALTILLAGGFSILLSLRSHSNVDARRLSLALAFAAFASAYMGFLRPFSSAVSWMGDVFAACCVPLAAHFWLRFFAHYPSRLDFARMEAAVAGRSFARSTLVDRVPQVQRLLLRLLDTDSVRRMNAAFVRLELRMNVTTGSVGFLIAGCIAFSALALAPYFGRETAPVRTVQFAAYGGLFTLAFVYAFQRLKANFAFGDEEDRRKSVWFFACLPPLGAMFLMLFTAWIVLGAFGNEAVGFHVFVLMVSVFPPLCTLTVLVAVIFSTMYHGTLDPRLVITKATLYGLIGLLMTTAFVAAEGAVSSQLVVRFGLPSQFGAVIAGTIAALSFGPVRNRVERAVQRKVDEMLPPSVLAEGERRLSAVAFNDLSGFTALSERDERNALLLAAVFHREGLRITRQTGGRIVKTIGDAIMFEFAECTTAVDAVVQLHACFVAACSSAGLDALPVHSGIHYGEVTRARSGDIFGRTVNVASRLEGVAAGGEIVVSQAVREMAGAHFVFDDLGMKTLKNVPDQVHCHRYAARKGTPGTTVTEGKVE